MRPIIDYDRNGQVIPDIATVILPEQLSREIHQILNRQDTKEETA